jgi:hypothetical protein
MRITVTGLAQAIAQIERLGTEGREEASRAVAETTLKIHADVVKKILRDPKTGYVYVRRAGGNLQTHRASAAGEAPANDSGGYVNSIQKKTNGLQGQVFSRMPRAFWLEHGTLRTAARPHFQPSVEENVEYFNERLRLAMIRATNRRG